MTRNNSASRPHLRAQRAASGVCIALTLALLQGCAPGFRTVKPIPSDSTLQTVPPEGAIQAITPELVRNKLLQRPTGVSTDVARLFSTSANYTIGPGDVVGVIVYDHPELLPNAGAVISQQSDPTGISVAPGFIVGANGEISFPYIGRVRLQGLSEIEASDLISRRIARYIKAPQVTVRIQSFRSQRAYVEGEVRTPGVQIFTDVPMTLAEAINRAGGINSAGDRSYVTLTRQKTTTVVDLVSLQELGADTTDIPLRNGDVINVHNKEDKRVYVMGEITRPTALPMRNGRLSLNEALGDAGGPNLLTADTGQVYVIRNTPAGAQEIYHLDASNPTALALADRFALNPRDVVYVDPVGLVQWNRVVSLILPAAQVVNLGARANN